MLLFHSGFPTLLKPHRQGNNVTVGRNLHGENRRSLHAAKVCRSTHKKKPIGWYFQILWSRRTQLGQIYKSFTKVPSVLHRSGQQLGREKQMKNSGHTELVTAPRVLGFYSGNVAHSRQPSSCLLTVLSQRKTSEIPRKTDNFTLGVGWEHHHEFSKLSHGGFIRCLRDWQTKRQCPIEKVLFFPCLQIAAERNSLPPRRQII